MVTNLSSMKQTFEDFLQDIHGKNYNGLDDDVPDSFDNWLSQLDGEEYIQFAESYGKLQFLAGKIAGLDKAE